MIVEGFDRFWQAYPRKVAKGAARKAWTRIRPTDALVDRMLSTLEWQSKSEQWTRDDGQFIPHPATWLNQERWDDEPVQVQPVTGRATAAAYSIRSAREALDAMEQHDAEPREPRAPHGRVDQIGDSYAREGRAGNLRRLR